MIVINIRSESTRIRLAAKRLFRNINEGNLITRLIKDNGRGSTTNTVIYHGQKTKETTEIIKLLRKWWPKRIVLQSGICTEDGINVYIPFEPGIIIPPLPGANKIEQEYKEEGGFLTNPKNWDKGLGLL